MSWEAVEWANKQRLRLPQEQLVLLLLANAADPDGLAFAWWKKKEHWWTYLAERGRQSRASVFRCLKRFEELGLLSREKLILADGVVRFRAQLHLDRYVDQEIREAQADSDVTNLTGETHSEDDPSLTAETDIPEAQSHSCDSIRVPLEATKEESISPQTPLSTDPGLEPFIEQFREAYPRPSSRPDEDRELIAAMDATARAQVLHGARGARRIFEKNPKSSGVVGPTRFLQSSALWAEYGRFAPVEKAPPPPRRFVAKGSEEWHARTVLSAIIGTDMPQPRHDPEHGCDGADFLGALPPGGLALAKFVDQFGNVDPKAWPIIDRDKNPQQIGAWRGRIRECTGREIELQRIDLGGFSTVPGIEGRTYKIPRVTLGLRVPDMFPPAKGPPAHGPPSESAA